MYRYTLINKNKIRCPKCGIAGKLSRYYDNQENALLPDNFGRCDREISCNYHEPPDKKGNMILTRNVEFVEKEHNIIPKKYLELSTKKMYVDRLSKYLISIFGKEAKNSLKKYFVGHGKSFYGDSTVFWQIASDGVRAGKIMQYNDEGKRVKVGALTTWVHRKLYEEGKFCLKQVFFGNHLNHEGKTIVIVESEKTAIIADMFFNNYNYVFMASGMLRGLQPHKFENLKVYKDIVLLPDYGQACEIWEDISYKLNIPKVRVSRRLEKLNLKEGEDLADAILFKKISDKSWISQI